MESKHDEMLMTILREEKNITGFFDSFFGFLYRYTDFYVESSPESRVGYPPGIAEQILVTISRKWQQKKKEDSEKPSTEEKDTNSEKSKSKPIPKPKKKEEKKEEKKVSASCYNGASCDNYSWSQSISELDVTVKLPPEIKKSKQVKVDLRPDSLEVSVAIPSKPEWQTLVKGNFSFEIKSKDCVWILEDGKRINITIPKAKDRWWESLLDTEAKIDINKLDCTRNMDEMSDAEHMKIDELMWKQRQKELGKPTTTDPDQRSRTEEILKKAWDADDSPFKGTKIDLSRLHFE